MGRWKPDGLGRLEEAALALFGERGYENTTVAQIAARAGLTERTFFRYFADKREVLFWGSRTLQELMVAAALRRRGTSGATATLTAEAGIAVFRVAFERWVTETAPKELPALIRESLEELRGVTAR